MRGPSWRPAVLAGTPAGRFLRYITLQVVAVSALASIAAPVALYFPDPLRLPRSLTVGSPATFASGTGAVATAWLLQALEVTALGLYVAVPVAVGWYAAARGDHRWPSAAAWAGVALLGLPWFGGCRWLLRSPAPVHRVLGGLLAVGAPTLVFAAHRVAAERAPERVATGPPPGIFVGFLLATAVVVGPLVVPAPPAGLGEGATSGGVARPSVAAEYDYRPTGDGRGVPTVTRGGGAAVEARQVSLVSLGDGSFAHVARTNQTGAKP